MEAEVTILVDSYNADFLKSLTHSALTQWKSGLKWPQNDPKDCISGRRKKDKPGGPRLFVKASCAPFHQISAGRQHCAAVQVHVVLD